MMLAEVESARCRICAVLGGVLSNPHQYGAAVLAKLAVNAATVIFFAIVLWKPDALKLWPGRGYLPVGDATENVFAIIALACATVAIARLIIKSPPALFGVIYYGATALAWLYVWATLCISIGTGLVDLRPGQFAGITTVTALSLFAFISNPKGVQGGGDGIGPIF